MGENESLTNFIVIAGMATYFIWAICQYLDKIIKRLDRIINLLNKN